jgi:hypothetical protein
VYVKKKRRMKGNESERMKNRYWEEKQTFGIQGVATQGRKQLM